MLEERNKRVGNLTGYDCKVCLNKGYTYIEVDDELRTKDCECLRERKILSNLKSNGLLNDFNIKTLENFKTPFKWQKTTKNKALEYLKTVNNEWFLICGVTGSGKTHIATAVSVELIKQGYDYHYTKFSIDLPRIAQGLNNFNDDVKVRAEQELKRLEEVDLLYIDDLLKVNKYTEEVVFQTLFTLINQRYINNKRTILTTERSLNDLINFDEAITGRIIERAKGFIIDETKGGKENNYRLRSVLK